MKKVYLIFIVLLTLIQLNSIIIENGDLFNFFFSSEPNCAYDKWESHIVEGIAEEGYNMYAPYDRQTEGFGQFTLPSEEQTEVWEDAVDYFFAGQYNEAHLLLVQNNIPYSVVELTDGEDIYYMLRENLNNNYIDNNGTSPSYDDETGSFDFGWGIFIYRTTNPNPIVVTAPHPNDDFISPYMAVQSFMELGAQYLMINGSGREVMWNGYGNYSNNKSYSDPTRNSNHPFNYFYAKACDKIREDYDRRELSVQLHSYDWNSHPERASCQISPGQYRRPAGIPIRDFSPLRQDVIQNTDYVVIPPGTIGNNTIVTVKDYYSVHNYFYPTTYHDSITISDNVDLPGYPESFHDNYSTDNYSDWDVFSPFFHVEFDELPNCYEQTGESFKLFYGYNSYINSWNLNQRYAKMSDYYQPFIDALTEAVGDWVVFDDLTDPQAPTNIRRFYGGGGNAIMWDIAPCYDFYSYEILYSLSPISQGNYSVINRLDTDNEELAFPVVNNTVLTNLQLNQVYYLAMRTVDYNGNVSPISEEIVFSTFPIITSEFDIYADNNSIEIEWTQSQQQNCSGFEIYRSQNDSDFELYASYTDNPGLVITNNYYDSYSFIDDNVAIDDYYSYRVNIVTNTSQSSQISQIMNAALANYVNVTATDSNSDRTVTFGKSHFATDDYDETYDKLYDEDWDDFTIGYNNAEFVRNIISPFDATEEVRYFDLNIYNAPTNLTFTLDNGRPSERFYLLYDDDLYSLDSQAVTLNFPETGTYNAQLIWGNLQAQVTFPDFENVLFYQGDQVELSWSIDYPDLVESIDLYFKNEQDSILVAEDLPAEQTSYAFTTNVNEDYRMMNLIARATSIDEEIKEFKSYSRFSFVAEIQPMSLDLSNPTRLISYPFTTSFDTNSLEGSIEAFGLVGQEFTNTDLLENNNGYFINIFSDCLLEYNGDPFLDATQYLITRGWNLIYNPHPVDYNIEDILFYKNSIFRSFKKAVEQELIIPQIVGLRDGCYTPVDTLKAFESAFLNQISNDDMFIRFDPGNQNEDFSYIQPELYFTLEFKTVSGVKDELTVGIQPGLAPIMDLYYDLMKAPLRPTNGLTEAYIVSEPPLSNYYPKMQTKLSEPISEDTYAWEIAFSNTLNQPVQVKIKESNNPNNYPLDLHFGGVTYRLTDDYLTIANTDLIGTYFADLTIMTVTDNSSNDVVPNNQFLISPNPIADQAKINIKNKRNVDFSITIYNIRGQKVKDFNIKDFKEDNCEINWNLTNNKGKRVSSGIYFVRYKDDLKNQTKKICVIKK